MYALQQHKLATSGILTIGLCETQMCYSLSKLTHHYPHQNSAFKPMGMIPDPDELF
jgi:hypothetical protein